MPDVGSAPRWSHGGRQREAAADPVDEDAETETGKDAQDPFAGNAEDVAAHGTRRKIELSAWADTVLGLSGVELELALDGAVKHFKEKRSSLKRIIKARRSEKEGKSEAQPRRASSDEQRVKYYSDDFKVSDDGVFAREVDEDGHAFWERFARHVSI